MKIKGSQKSMRGLRLVGEEESGNAFSLYGPKRAGLITTPRTHDKRFRNCSVAWREKSRT